MAIQENKKGGVAALTVSTMVVGVLLFTMTLFASGASAASNPFLRAWKHQPGAQVGASESSASSEVIVLAYNSFKKGTEINSPKCHWADGENSGETATGEVFWFYDTHMWVCPNKESPYEWVKVKGGMTGAHCYNAVKLNTPPKPKLKIVLVKTFGKFEAVANAHAREKVKGACGVAEASANAHGMAYGMTRVQAKGNAKLVATSNAKAKSTASAKARVALVCSSQPQAPPAATPEIPKSSVKCAAGFIEKANGVCVSMVQEAEQTCSSVINGNWNTINQKCKITQIQGNCSTIVVLEEVYVKGPLTINIENETCVNKEERPKEPEEPEKPKTPEPPVVEWERIQEVYTNHERVLCVTATPTSVVGSVQFGVKWGSRSNGGVGVYNASTNKYCVTYTAPSEEPPHVCEEAISSKLPAGTKCDIANVAVFSNNGAKTVTATMEIPVLTEESQVVW